MKDASQGEFTIVLGVRQLAVALFMLFMLVATFAAVSYVVGRIVMAPVTATAQSAPPEDVLVVDAAGEKTPGKPPQQPAAPEASRPKPAPAAAPAFESYYYEPAPGQLFLQVAAADRGIAEVFAEYLARKEFTPRIATGPDERSYRVLVGPIENNEQLSELRTGLEKAGFHPFLRRYKPADNGG